MSENDTESPEPSSITDDRLPADLVASEDNPLAEGLPPGEEVAVMDEGKRADEMPDDDDDNTSEGGSDGGEDAADEEPGS